MSLNLKELLSQTELKNKSCVREFLESRGFTTVPAIDNLPGKYGLPFLCGNGVTVVVAEIRRVIQAANDDMPTIEEAIEVADPEPEPRKDVLQGEMPVTKLKIDGVTAHQLNLLSEAGIETLADLFEDEDAIDQVPGIGEATKNRILQAVTEALEKQ